MRLATRLHGVRILRYNGVMRINPLVLLTASVFMLGNTGSVSLAEEAVEAQAAPAQAELANRYVGAFTLVGAGNTAFDVIVRADGTAHSTWVGSAGGAQGESGTWKPYGNGVLVEYRTGWRDWLRVTDSGAESAGPIQQATWKDGQSLLEPPYAVARALRIDGPRAPFVGVFTIQRSAEPTLAVTLQSSGRAFSNAHGTEALVPGIWWVEDGKARMIWADGWRNEFTRGQTSWTQKAWQPETDFSAIPWKTGSLDAVATPTPH